MYHAIDGAFTQAGAIHPGFPRKTAENNTSNDQGRNHQRRPVRAGVLSVQR
jgi:hypothetical protein